MSARPWLTFDAAERHSPRCPRSSLLPDSSLPSPPPSESPQPESPQRATRPRDLPTVVARSLRISINPSLHTCRRCDRMVVLFLRVQRCSAQHYSSLQRLQHLQHYSTTALQHYSTIALQHYSTTAPCCKLQPATAQARWVSIFCYTRETPSSPPGQLSSCSALPSRIRRGTLRLPPPLPACPCLLPPLSPAPLRPSIRSPQC